MKMRWITAALLALAASAASAQYPTKPVTMMVPYAAGQTVIVENRPSNGGILAPEVVKNAKPDGYTILIHHIGMATIPALYRQLRFNPLTDFEYIGLVNDVPMTIIARHDFPAKDFKEFLAYLKANKAKVNAANAGIGAASHLCGMLFMSAIQTDLTMVQYKGTAPAMNDLLGGTVDFMCDQTTSTTNQIKSGKVKVFGVTSKTRVKSLPDVPTLDEQGLKGFEIGVWHALYAPKGTPKETIDKLSHSLQEALKDPVVNQRFADLGATAYPPDKATPAALEAQLKSEIAKWGPIIKKAGVYAD